MSNINSLFASEFAKLLTRQNRRSLAMPQFRLPDTIEPQKKKKEKQNISVQLNGNSVDQLNAKVKVNIRNVKESSEPGKPLTPGSALAMAPAGLMMPNLQRPILQLNKIPLLIDPQQFVTAQ